MSNNKKIDDKKNFIAKLIYNKKIVNDYDSEELNTLENTIYKDMNEYEKVKYEIENLYDYDIKLNNYENIKIKRRLEDEIVSLYKEYEITKSNEYLEKLKEIISALQILLDEDYGFYNTVKNFDDLFFNYIDEVINKEEKIYKKKGNK